MQNDNEKKINPKENHSQDSLPKVNLRQNENNTNNEVKKTVTATEEPINGIPGSKHTSEIGNSITNATNRNLKSEKPNEKTNDYKTASNIGFNSQKLPNHNIKEKPKQSSNKQSLEKSSEKKKPLDKSTKNPKNPNFDKNTGLKNPTKRLPSQKKYSKHAKNDENSSNNTSEENKQKKPFDGLKSQLANRLLNRNKKREETSENESEETTGQEVLNSIGGNIKQLLGIIAGFIGMTPFAISGLLIALVVIVICAIIVPIISSLSFYGEDDDGTVCFVASPCTSVIIKNSDTEKTYALDEYIAGAMVNKYEYLTIAKSSLLGFQIDDDLLKALAVIIHSDLATYATYDSNTETCTIDSSMIFNTVYEPPADDSTASDESGTVGDDDDQSENTINDQISNVIDSVLDTSNETSQAKRYKEYYDKAKQAADSVISEVVDIYNEDIDLFYSNYVKVLHDAVDAKKDYKGIVRAYIRNSPDYNIYNTSDVTDEDNDESSDNTSTDDKVNTIGVYPICHFDINRKSGETTYYSDNICSTVVVNDQYSHGEIYSGTYTIDDFIAGTVYAEARAWYKTPEMMKAQAVAARTYLVNRARVENGTCYITTSTSTMSFTKNTIPEIDAAVKETSGEYIMVNGGISKEAEWDALRVVGTSGSNYIIAQKNQLIPKAWLDAPGRLFNSIEWYNRYSHGRGMSQYGAYYLASVQNKTYKEIINYYYGGDVSIIAQTNKNGYAMPLSTFTYISGEIHDRCDDAHTYRDHKGIDFAAPKGTPVYAAHSGTVSKLYNTTFQCYPNCTDNQKPGFGVAIDNGDGTTSYYFHFSSRENLAIGQQVELGEKLGEVGNTGNTYGASGGYHLHYQVLGTSDGSVKNPRDYLPMDEKGYGLCYDPRKSN